MAISTVECANCGNPTQQISLDSDGHCPRCSKCRISSPPPDPATPPPEVSSFQRTGHHGSTTQGLMREPIRSKIPIADLIESGALNLPPSARIPVDADRT